MLNSSPDDDDFAIVAYDAARLRKEVSSHDFYNAKKIRAVAAAVVQFSAPTAAAAAAVMMPRDEYKVVVVVPIAPCKKIKDAAAAGRKWQMLLV